MQMRAGTYFSIILASVLVVMVSWNVHAFWFAAPVPVRGESDLAETNASAKAVTGFSAEAIEPATTPEDLLDHENYNVIVTDNAYTREREPIPLTDPEEEQPEEPLGMGLEPLEMVVEGIVTAGGEPVAWIRRDKGKLTREIRVGTEIEGWEVREITATEVIFAVADGSQQQSLVVFEEIDPSQLERPEGLASDDNNSSDASGQPQSNDP